jgi:hypothetical protein
MCSFKLSPEALPNKKPLEPNTGLFNSVTAASAARAKKSRQKAGMSVRYAMTRVATVGTSRAAHNWTNCRSLQAAAARALQCRHAVRA